MESYVLGPKRSSRELLATDQKHRRSWVQITWEREASVFGGVRYSDGYEVSLELPGPRPLPLTKN